MRTADDQEPRLCRLPENSHIERPSRFSNRQTRVLPVDACTVVRLQRNELARRIDAGQPEDVKAAGRGLAIGVERRPAGDHRVREPVHVRPVLLQQLLVVTKLCRTGRISAVYEEVQLQRKPRRRPYAAMECRGVGFGNRARLPSDVIQRRRRGPTASRHEKRARRSGPSRSCRAEIDFSLQWLPTGSK